MHTHTHLLKHNISKPATYRLMKKNPKLVFIGKQPYSTGFEWGALQHWLTSILKVCGHTDGFKALV